MSYINYSSRAMPTVTGGNEIRVTGEGKVSVQPNQAQIIIGITTEDSELIVAQNQNQTLTNQVIEALVSLPIQRDQIKTTEYSIFPQYDFKDGVQTFRNYRVDHRLTVTTTDLQLIGPIVDTSINNGANSINGVNFTVTNSQSYEQQALTLAIQHATGKALTLAKAIHVQLLHPPVLIVESGSNQPIEPFMQQATMVKGVSTTTIEPGLFDVKAMVTAVFKY